jgi:hypothetical protein
LKGKAKKEVDTEVERLTLIAVQKGDRIQLQEEGKTIWVWRGEEGGSKEVILVGPTVVLC